MKIGVFHPVPNLSADAAVIARHAEDLGFESYWTADHTILPVESSRPYPGLKEDGKAPDYLWQMPDPLISLARAGAVTTRINLGTGICLVPERNAILAAKQIASLDSACGGRFLFGIGAGWNPEESRILGGDFDHRWSQVKDHILAMKELWTKDISEYHGKYVDFPPVRCFPKPARRPHPPVLLGSIQNDRALRRVVEWGDGWVPIVWDADELAAGVAKIRELAEKAGRDFAEIDISPFGFEGQWRDRATIDALEKAGADRVVIWLAAQDRDGLLKEMDEVAKTLGVTAA
jgi:probable F420-dependent oxidoreductase